MKREEGLLRLKLADAYCLHIENLAAIQKKINNLYIGATDPAEKIALCNLIVDTAIEIERTVEIAKKALDPFQNLLKLTLVSSSNKS